MAYDEYLEERIRIILQSKGIPFEAKKMMGGLCFMVDGKMLAGVVKDELMARVGPEQYSEALRKEGAKEMNFTGRSMKGYVFVEAEALDQEEALQNWIEDCLRFNPDAKASKKKD